MKLSIDGGFTCPNRDGKVGSRGDVYSVEKKVQENLQVQG